MASGQRSHWLTKCCSSVYSLPWSDVCLGQMSALVRCLPWSDVCPGQISVLARCLSWSDVCLGQMSALVRCLPWSDVCQCCMLQRVRQGRHQRVDRQRWSSDTGRPRLVPSWLVYTTHFSPTLRSYEVYLQLQCCVYTTHFNPALRSYEV